MPKMYRSRTRENRSLFSKSGRNEGRGRARRVNRRRGNPYKYKGNMVSKRAPLVETKSKNSAGSLSFGNYYNVIIPDCYEKHTQGLLEGNVIGSSIFAKYLNSQFQITFATNETQQLNQPIVLQVLHGWCKLPENIPPTKAPAGSPPGANDGVVHDFDPTAHVIQYLTSIFDPNVTLPKNDREILKLKFNKEFHMLGSQILFDNNDDKIIRYRKPLNFYCKWKPMRKLKLEQVSTAATGAASHLSPSNKPGQWIPFFACINKTNSTATGPAAPICLANSTFYFTDS
jgi:hypothetical protein